MQLQCTNLRIPVNWRLEAMRNELRLLRNADRGIAVAAGHNSKKVLYKVLKMIVMEGLNNFEMSKKWHFVLNLEKLLVIVVVLSCFYCSCLMCLL